MQRLADILYHTLLLVPFSLLQHPATTEIYTLSLHDALPISGMIRYSPSDEDFERRVLGALLQGIPRADAAAVVCVKEVAGKEEIEVRRELRRDSRPGGLRPSKRLITKAICRRRQSVLHSWGPDQAGDNSLAFTMNMEHNWAL